MIPLSTYEKLNLSKVRTLEFNFPYEKITDGKLSIDKIQLLKKINKNTVPIVNDQILLVIWQEENKLQSKFPEVEQGNLEKLKAWAAYTDLRIPLTELHLEEEIPPEVQNTIQSESEKLMTPSVNSGMDADALIPILQAIVGVTVVVIGGLFGYKTYKDYKKDRDTISPERACSF